MAIQSYPAIPARYHGILSEDRTRTWKKYGEGGGSAFLLSKSPRMRVNYAQLDHYLEFYYQSTCSNRPAFWPKITFPGRWKSSQNAKSHNNNDTRTNCGTVYTQYCKEVNFTAFSRSTMLRVLSSCAATVRKSSGGRLHSGRRREGFRWTN